MTEQAAAYEPPRPVPSWLDADDVPVFSARKMQEALDAIQALADALDRTQANLVTAINGRPVRDMCETLAENHAAALKGARLMPMPTHLMRQP